MNFKKNYNLKILPEFETLEELVINANQGLNFLTYSFIATKTQRLKKIHKENIKNTNYNLVKLCVLVSLWQKYS